MSAKVLVVAGMHRSGTSVVTQWLNRCGLFIGSNLIGADIGNVQGHYEDADFLRINEKLLKKRNLPASGFTAKRPAELSELEKTELKGLIELKGRKHEQWGWKEPRTSLFLGEYHALLPDAFYVIVVRGFNETVNSIITREYKMRKKRYLTKKGFSKLKWFLFKRKSQEKIFENETDKFLKIWIHYYEMILEHLRTLENDRYVLIDYAELNRNDKNFFSKIKNDWNFSLDYLPFKNVYQKDLLSEVRDIKKYVNNKDLLAKATAIEQYIQLNYRKNGDAYHGVMLRAV